MIFVKLAVILNPLALNVLREFSDILQESVELLKASDSHISLLQDFCLILNGITSCRNLSLVIN